ncbi:hypothetical protein JANAI62_27350 [Jannaschia pagri]|uniref:Uncharacterized protein n=1 Tax=Jannaschia pagri TaxID=2829797 RepID=A0ABQ4NNX2_9RHOB|nr:hypothetical protein JANAI61_27360 [Jannaschia sp. AI_61]GIT96112.1 hypothetical protein JANAI62_27350 [Jannaschia sp. AI_62]
MLAGDARKIEGLGGPRRGRKRDKREDYVFHFPSPSRLGGFMGNDDGQLGRIRETIPAPARSFAGTRGDTGSP